jgi:CDP-diacylglycerol--glycerol-3-phosphate 3-phosphatidyltransferase
MFNLANSLTLSRFLLAPLFLLLMLNLNTPNPTLGGLSLGILIITLLTDMFDGMAARAQNQVTNFGKIMDPVADSTFFLTALFAFSAVPRFGVPIWLPLIVLYREVGMHVLRRYAALNDIVLAAKFSGKAKMVVQCVVTFALLLFLILQDSNACQYVKDINLKHVMLGGTSVIAFVNIISMIEYLREIPKFKDNPNQES